MLVLKHGASHNLSPSDVAAAAIVIFSIPNLVAVVLHALLHDAANNISSEVALSFFINTLTSQ